MTRVVALSGGVGGARFAHGLSRALPGESLTIIVNTGDDFEHWGLAISPDLDTVMYTLSDLGDEERGWGLLGETFRALEMMKRYGANQPQPAVPGGATTQPTTEPSRTS